MTASVQALLMTGSGVVPPPAELVIPLPTMLLKGTYPVSAPGGVAVYVNADGTIQVGGNESTISSPPAWWQPTQPGIGSAYWVRMSLISGAAPDGTDLPDVWLPLTIDRDWLWSQGFVVGTKTAVGKLDLSTSSTGTPIVSSSPNFNVNVVTQNGVVNPIPSIVVGDDQISGFAAQASFLLRTDGTITVTGNTSSTAGNYYLPTTVVIGQNYWARLTVLSGSAPSLGPAPGTWNRISSIVEWGWSRSVLGTTLATVKLELATTSGGTPIVATEASIPVTLTVAS